MNNGSSRLLRYEENIRIGRGLFCLLDATFLVKYLYVCAGVMRDV